jgi:hypothetical protein
LTALRKYCNNSGKAEETVWRVEVRGFGTGINIRELSEREVGQLNDNSEPRRLGIVPEWFVNEVRKQGWMMSSIVGVMTRGSYDTTC